MKQARMFQTEDLPLFSETAPRASVEAYQETERGPQQARLIEMQHDTAVKASFRLAHRAWSIKRDVFVARMIELDEGIFIGPRDEAMRLNNFKSMHRQAVLDRLKDRRPVAAGVLADYPELKR